ncbi:MAG TPA: LLM class flavin-dependent oxidoreductase [Acidimicrobiales bacterium]|nr:LLM class flavin-dependent oxidoreductase [Acidimicrobiales bacterium]
MNVVVRFNFVQPGLDRERMSDRYRVALDMFEFADRRGFSMVQLEEHHGADDGWSPSPVTVAGAVAGRTARIGIGLFALLFPLYDPLRLAEDLAVLDLMSGGRVTTLAALGYRPGEYEAHRKDWARRGALMDEVVAAVLAAWTGEPFDYHGHTVRVTPVPLTTPHPPLLLGGATRVAARRAARFGLPFAPSAYDEPLVAYYREQCALAGTEPSTSLPRTSRLIVHVAEDPDRAWATLGPHFLHEAQTYAGWQPPKEGPRPVTHSLATTVDELRAEGIYQVLTPDECRAIAAEEGDDAFFSLHPLCGGMPPDEGWGSLALFADQVLGAPGQ